MHPYTALPTGHLHVGRREACSDGNFVARFAVSPGDGDFLERCARMSVHQFDVVVAVVQRHPRVVAHPAVDGDEGSSPR